MSQTSSPSPQTRFLELLRRDVLKIDLADLDFGIYRILNFRRAEVLKFLDVTLPARIRVQTDALAAAHGSELATEEEANVYYHLHTFFSRYWDEGDFIPRARRGGSAAYAVPYRGEDTYFHWATKGSHYIKSGEFFSRYAYTQGADDASTTVIFAIDRADTEKTNAKGEKRHFFPHRLEKRGQSLTIFWQWRTATPDENKRYGDKKTKVAKRTEDDADDSADADNDSDAIDAVEAVEGNGLQEKVINAWLAGQGFTSASPASHATAPASLDTALLEKHVRRFVRKHTSDFFVHPQLKAFLEGELDVYLKHEFVQVWDAKDEELPRIRSKFALVRAIALDLIAFLDQIERFQATLFEKRKFVTRADYLVQVSGLLRTQHADAQALIDEAAANAAQVNEWLQWVGEKPLAENAAQGSVASPRGTSPQGAGRNAVAVPNEVRDVPTAHRGRRAAAGEGKEVGSALLARFPHLPIHTKHFDRAFRDRLLACFSDIEAATGGELFHADNYAALRTMEPAYKNRVKCIYIDPPYNTDAGPIDYKNDLRDASWLSLLEGRLRQGRRLLCETGIACATIDDYELHNLSKLIEAEFGGEMMGGTVAIRINPSGRPKPSGLASAHEYAIFALKSAASELLRLPRTEEQKRRYKETNEYGTAFMWELFRKRGSNSERFRRRKLWYPIYVSEVSVRIPKLEWVEEKGEWLVLEKPLKNEETVFPIDDQGTERTWRWMESEARKDPGLLKAERSNKGDWIVYYQYSPENDGVLPTTVWTDAKYSATEHGTGVVKSLFGHAEAFSYPKSVFAVEDCLRVGGLNTEECEAVTLDFFAGSGTTGHAVINLNREDGGARKFILVEQGEYFDTVTLPRIAKVMSSPEWKDGKPKEGVNHDAANADEAAEHWSRRTLPIVRVLRLEHYEDSLDALDLSARAANDAQQNALPLAETADETLIRYALTDASEGSPVLLSTEALKTPFDYRLSTLTPNLNGASAIEMMETIRLLIGLLPQRIMAIRDEAGFRHELMEASLASDAAKGVSNPAPVLVWLRNANDDCDMDAAKAERNWLQATVKREFNRSLAEYATIFHNRSALWLPGERGESLDSLLRDRMMERAQ